MPSEQCIVYTCKNKRWISKKSNTTGKISYHLFPKVPSERKKWTRALQLSDSIVTTRTSLVCSDHFQHSDFERDLKSELMGLPPKRVLKSGAVPNRNLPLPKTPQLKTNIKTEDVEQQCSVIGCEHKMASAVLPDIEFHEFPVSNEALLRDWAVFAGHPESFQPGPGDSVCSVHFRPQDYVIIHRGGIITKSLRRTAAPTLKRPVYIVEEEVEDDGMEDDLKEEESVYDSADKEFTLLGNGVDDSVQVLIVGDDGVITKSEVTLKKEVNEEEEVEVEEEEEGEETEDELPPKKRRRIEALEEKLEEARKKIKMLQQVRRRYSKRYLEMKELLRILVLKRGMGRKNLTQLLLEYTKDQKNEEEEPSQEDLTL